MNESPPQPEVIPRLFDAVYPSFAMLAGMELDLFTPLADGPLTLEQLAVALGVEPVKLRPLLYALVMAGLLNLEDDLFSNTTEADHYLVRDKPAYLGGQQKLNARNWQAMLEMAATIRRGGPPDRVDYHTMTQEEMIDFFRGLNTGAVADAGRLMEQHDFSATNTLLDVGGGSGGLAIAMVQANPHLKATIVDLPSVTTITRQFVKEANVRDRVEVLPADLLRDKLAGQYDVVVARHMLQVFSAEDNRVLLGKVAAVLKPGGALHLVGWILDDSRLSPQKTVNYNLILLNAYKDGQAYTEGEYSDWLTGAGFGDLERVVMPDGASFMTARKIQVNK